MSNHIICFSPSGATLGQRILAVEDVFAADWELTQCFGADHESLSDWTKRVFQPGNNLLFIGAAGIAVRAIAPYVREKQSDPAVVVMDEKANWCIPILSGHLGGANLLANKLAKMTGAQAAITTATDVRGVWAVDSWAKQEGLTVVNPSGIKEISAGLLQGQTKKLFSEFPISGKLPEGLVFSDAASCDIYIGIHRLTDRKQEPLYLIPAALIAGIGCRKGAQREQLDALFEEVLEQNNVWQQAVQNMQHRFKKRGTGAAFILCRTWYFAGNLRCGNAPKPGRGVYRIGICQSGDGRGQCLRTECHGGQPKWENSDFQNGEKRRDGSLCTG